MQDLGSIQNSPTQVPTSSSSSIDTTPASTSGGRVYDRGEHIRELRNQEIVKVNSLKSNCASSVSSLPNSNTTTFDRSAYVRQLRGELPASASLPGSLASISSLAPPSKEKSVQ